MSIPYEHATAGGAARDEIIALLRRLRCERIGFMDDFENSTLVLAFVHRGRQYEMHASAAGWAEMWLRANPWTTAKRTKEPAYKKAALEQGMIAVNSVLRDWVKGQVMAIECGAASLEEMFLAQTLLADGTRIIDHAQKLLPLPQQT